MLRTLFGALLLLAGLTLCPVNLLAQETYVIGPVNESADIRAFSAQGWLSMQGLPPKDHYLLKISYLRGFLDAIQFAEVAPGQTTNMLDDFKGGNLKELADQIDQFYQNYPQYQSYSPAVVMLVILPRIKAGQSPLPVETGETELTDSPPATQDTGLPKD
ncbi:MAG: hypothetical protein JRC92_04190 [Deltaproteobacteria bacterium]|nr:hypothetical protein [Deltaproteobacteria bacterium]